MATTWITVTSDKSVSIRETIHGKINLDRSMEGKQGSAVIPWPFVGHKSHLTCTFHYSTAEGCKARVHDIHQGTRRKAKQPCLRVAQKKDGARSSDASTAVAD